MLSKLLSILASLFSIAQTVEAAKAEQQAESRGAEIAAEASEKEILSDVVAQNAHNAPLASHSDIVQRLRADGTLSGSSNP